jgi:hypothetical protein
MRHQAGAAGVIYPEQSPFTLNNHKTGCYYGRKITQLRVSVKACIVVMKAFMQMRNLSVMYINEF